VRAFARGFLPDIIRSDHGLRRNMEGSDASECREAAATSSHSTRASWRRLWQSSRSIGYLILFESQNVLPHLTAFAFTEDCHHRDAGSILLMWPGAAGL